ncbi:MAG: hypothetical protein D8M58_21050 [Calditrichaeota bacterium]|nr:MAG: hypothetical protein DWQ03_16765 [Calditrichota bacterium]MBL1207900.1 hypothetical protein [Calditrichota bacterium]NOG47735.1 hypothetical protein [Calditrichota bacterium]
MEITAAEFRQNVYKFLDEVIKSGKSITIIKEGKKINLSPYLEEKTGMRAFFKKKDEAPDEHIHLDLSEDWETEDK